MSKFQTVRGTRDILGLDVKYFNQVIDVASHFAKVYSYNEIKTPIFEFSDVFHKTLGDTSDIISKETYTFMDRDKTSITLRPEFTAGVVRALISNGLTQTLPQKLFSYGPLFRHERPQKARYRQFNQINYEFIGVGDAYSDVEVIFMAYDILTALGLAEHVKLELNTLGDIESRVNYRAKIVEYFSQYKEDLSEDSKMRLERNPLRILDSKEEQDRKIIAGAPKGGDSLTIAARKYFERLLEGLDYVNINYEINDRLVRGLDYYTHTVFEFTTDRLGSQGTVLAGGRYDGLVETMGGPPTPAVGFAAGVERLAELMQELGVGINEDRIVVLVPIGEACERFALKLAHDLRSNGLKVDLDFMGNMGKRMKRANRVGASACLIFGDDELSRNSVKVKDMASGEEMECKLPELALKLRAAL